MLDTTLVAAVVDTAAQATQPPPIDPSSLIPLLPAKWQAPVAIVLIASMIVSRMVYALVNGKNLWKAIGSVFYGTNEAKKLPVIIAVLFLSGLLTSCMTQRESLTYTTPGGDTVKVENVVYELYPDTVKVSGDITYITSKSSEQVIQDIKNQQYVTATVLIDSANVRKVRAKATLPRFWLIR